MRTSVSKTSPLKKMIDFKTEINDVDLSAITIKDEHTVFFIFTGDQLLHRAGGSFEVWTASSYHTKGICRNTTVFEW
jgi:hypothetical protein